MRKSIFGASIICGIALCLLYFIGCSLSAAAQDASRTTARVVSEKRVQELKDLRWGMFICWSFSTFSGREWTGDVAKRTDYDKLFPAKKVDTDQWAKTAKEAGMGYILFLTKHHDGFCLWDTKTTERKVTNAPLGKDVLRALRKSCDKYGIKLALYFSEGDWTWDGATDGKVYEGGSNPEMKKAQLRELLTGYGAIEYIWFDHAAGTGGLSHEETTAWCKQFQPDCFVGYNHGDQSTADIRLGEMGKPGSLDDAAAPYMGEVKENKWRLAEFTYPILPEHEGGAMWFYSLPAHDGLVHPASKLFDDYLGAVKYGNIFSIDVGPDYNGKLRDIDVKTLREVGKLIRKDQNQYVLRPDRAIDNLEQLPAAIASRPDAVTVETHQWALYFWLNNFGGRPDDCLTWHVRSDMEKPTDYFAWLKISANAGTQLRITVTQDERTISTTDFTKPNGDWETVDFGTITIPSGVSEITLMKVTAANQSCSVKSLDIIRASDRAAYENRIAAYKADNASIRNKFQTSDYGAFLQYGAWGYPQSGDKKDMETFANEFDVDNFVDLLEVSGFKFCLWSLTWWTQQILMPNDAMDRIMGHKNLTTERNLVGEIAAECHKRGIDFYLYYHHGTHQSPEWGDKLGVPRDFGKTGVRDGTTFFNSECAVISEVGQRLGTNLDGWFFDDAGVWYPGPFERVAKAAKTGNSNRLVSYNAWVGPKVSEFNDVSWFEGSWGRGVNVPDGYMTSGPEQGMISVAMPCLNQGWGIESANTVIRPNANVTDLISKVKTANAKGNPCLLNFMMYEDGTINQETLNALIALKAAMGRKERI
jgi:alpha-L-fucosidase